jgi:ubiquinone/menaquinone biosynthesis C-methylase UbiE
MGDMLADATLAGTSRQPGLPVPAYLKRIYWWAYVHPRAVYVFERQWLVNLILFGNFGRLRDMAIRLLEPRLAGRTLQIACVYGNLTNRLAALVPGEGQLDVLDVLPVQIDNLQKKLPAGHRVGLIHGDSSRLDMIASASYDQALLFFLLHEQPEDVRRATLAEALRVLRPGGRLLIIDYHRPREKHPLRWVMKQILCRFEPFAMDLWQRPVSDWFPAGGKAHVHSHRLLFGGLYQVLEVVATDRAHQEMP